MTEGAHRLGALIFLCWAGLSGGNASSAPALEPPEILVLANKNARGSIGLAKYYMEKRGIPMENLLLLQMTDKEQCSREAFDQKAAGPVRAHLRGKDPLRRIRCLVCMYGLPIKVAPPALNAFEKKELDQLNRRRAELAVALDKAKGEKSEKEKELAKQYDELNQEIRKVQKQDCRSSFDSEIALVMKGDYPLAGWLPNPFFVGFKGEGKVVRRDETLMVARLDGPDEGIVRRIIEQSLEAEKTGLKGIAYFDARWPRPGEEQTKKMDTGYGFYDRSIHLAAERVKKSGRMPVVLNDRQELFKPGECTDAALYCGWYSLARYVPAFAWQPGAVGYHIASSECTTLRAKDSQVWCKRMLEEGVAATVGPVGEPYVQAFPIPEVFFGLLVEGRLALAECYLLSIPFLSWQMILVGDPLYRPFGRQGGANVEGRAPGTR